MKRICVCTSYSALAEPRAPRHAAWLAERFPDARIIFVMSLAAGDDIRLPPALARIAGLEVRVHRYRTRRSGLPGLVIQRLRHRLASAVAGMGGPVSGAALAAHGPGLDRLVDGIDADMYVAHTIDCLAAAAAAARRRRARLVFDSMEYHADLGDGQTAAERRLVGRLQQAVLPRCDAVLASSPEVAAALHDDYGITRLWPLRNVPDRLVTLPHERLAGINLYWRNSVIGFGQRGLDDALLALSRLPPVVSLYLQGRPAMDGGAALERRVAELGIKGRVHVLPPYFPTEAVAMASRYQIGLCVERRGPRNQDLTTSNKIYDYHMAGLAVVASDLEGLANVVRASGGGDTFRPGDPDDLAALIRRYVDQPDLLARRMASARAYALDDANADVERRRFNACIDSMLAAG